MTAPARTRLADLMSRPGVHGQTVPSPREECDCGERAVALRIEWEPRGSSQCRWTEACADCAAEVLDTALMETDHRDDVLVTVTDPEELTR